MIISKQLTSDQLRQVHNLIMNCTDKQDMFDHLIHIGLNAFHAIIMSNSYNKQNASYSVLPLVAQQQRKTYHYENGKPVLTEV